jgi:hypothetical protein
MDGILVWMAGAVGLLAWLASVVALRVSRAVWPWRSTWFGVAIACVGYLVTYPSRPPFHAGHGLGWGFTLGALGMVMAMHATAAPACAASMARSLTASGGALGASVAVSAVVLLAFPSVRVDTMVGLMLGWLTVGVCLWPDSTEDSDGDQAQRLAIAATTFAAFLCVGLALTAFRGATPVQSYIWATCVLIVGAAACVGVHAAGVLARAAWSQDSAIIAGSVVSVLIGLTAWLAAAGIAGPIPGSQGADRIFWCAMLGLALGSILLSLISADRAVVVSSHALLALTGAAAALPAFQIMAGLGVAVTGLTLVPMLLATGLATDTSRTSGTPNDLRVLAPLGILIALTGVRLVIERYTLSLRPFTLADHYAIIAFMFGAFVPPLLAHWSACSRSIVRQPALAIVSALWPIVLLVVWGAKSLFGTVVGLGLGPVFQSSHVEGQNRALRLGFLSALLGVFGSAQFAPFAVRFADLTRVDRARLIALFGAACIVLYVISEVERRRRPETT